MPITVSVPNIMSYYSSGSQAAIDMEQRPPGRETVGLKHITR